MVEVVVVGVTVIVCKNVADEVVVLVILVVAVIVVIVFVKLAAFSALSVDTEVGRVFWVSATSLKRTHPEHVL